MGRSEIQQETTGRVLNFNKSINWHHHMKDDAEIGDRSLFIGGWGGGGDWVKNSKKLLF